MSFDIYHDVSINSSLEKVYDAFSLPAELINWWPLECSGERKLSETYRFYFGPEYDWKGEVIKLEENKSFHVKMTSSDKDWSTTQFGFNLEETNGEVLAKFFHKGWQQCNAHFRRSSFCWALLLNGLKDYVEKGIIIPFDERN